MPHHQASAGQFGKAQASKVVNVVMGAEDIILRAKAEAALPQRRPQGLLIRARIDQNPRASIGNQYAGAGGRPAIGAVLPRVTH